MITVYGGTHLCWQYLCNMYEDTLVMPRDQRNPVTDNILYLISTIDNYNIHTDITLMLKLISEFYAKYSITVEKTLLFLILLVVGSFMIVDYH